MDFRLKNLPIRSNNPVFPAQIPATKCHNFFHEKIIMKDIEQSGQKN